jgi:hypothetical protein
MIEVMESKELSRSEMEEAIRIGVIPYEGNREPICTMVTRILKENTNWQKTNGLLTITSPSVVITFGETIIFEWKS